MRIHKEGGKPLMILLLVLSSLYLVFEYLWPMNDMLTQFFLVLAMGLIVFFLQFFRNPIRITEAEDLEIVCPADGKVVIVEKVLETEYFKEERLQVSIFMSPLNVHVNRFPIRGKVAYSKYHKGKFLVAWNPKSSLLNERTTVVVQHPSGQQLLYRQIAGALARRIINYAREGMIAMEGSDCGFIRFGSRVDLLLPLDTDIRVEIGEKVRGGETLIGRLNG
ncbi:MAG: phosphatidylserine decarboxylase family protein [Flavobacteriia bacterium]|nr:phosphatidylserine decarboxylase family protein [Flavobacteriia bacterium]